MMVGKIVKNAGYTSNVCAIVVAASLAGLSSQAAGTVEYALSYISVPGRIVFVKTNLIALSQESFDERVGFGSIGFRLGVSLPARLGPFVVGVETGFGLPAGSQVFDHRDLNDPASITAGLSKNVTHEGDFTTLKIMTVPIFFKLRYAPPSHDISLGGEFGFGPMLLGRNVERSLSFYDDTTGDLIGRITSEDHDLVVAVAVELGGGIVVPVTEVLSLHLFGGLLWLSDVSTTTTVMSPGLPVLVGGGSPFDPGLKLGGLGYTARLSLSHGL